MLLPEDILQTQLCYECKGYLTVLPIKVYPNRHVKCGRCVQEDDNGVISNLYETVMSNFEFPCRNRLEGCSKIMNINEIKSHEEDCEERRHICPFCSEFIDSAYKLYLHLKNKHQQDALTSMDVFIELDQGNIGKTSWFYQEKMLLIILSNYDNLDEKLSLNINIVGELNREYTTQNFVIKTFSNDIKYKTKNLPCLSWSQISNERFIIPICAKDFPRNVVVCQFEVKNLALDMPVVNDLVIVDYSARHVKRTCVIKNISTLKIDETKTVYSDLLLYVSELKFRVFIQKTGKELYVYIISACPGNITIPKLSYKFTLKSKKVKKHIYFQFTKLNAIWQENQGLGPQNFITWNDLINEDNGYIENDSIEIEVEIECDGPKAEKIVCSTCCEKCKQKVCDAFCEKCKQKKPETFICKEHAKENINIEEKINPN